MKALRIENGEGRMADPASVTGELRRMVLPSLDRIRRYLGADPKDIVAAGIRRGWVKWPAGQPMPIYLTPGICPYCGGSGWE